MSRISRWTTMVVTIGLLTVIALAGWRYAGRGGGEVKFIENGTASWYGPGFHGRKTASGERYDQNDLTAAHKKLPLGSEAQHRDGQVNRGRDQRPRPVHAWSQYRPV